MVLTRGGQRLRKQNDAIRCTSHKDAGRLGIKSDNNLHDILYNFLTVTSNVSNASLIKPQTRVKHSL